MEENSVLEFACTRLHQIQANIQLLQEQESMLKARIVELTGNKPTRETFSKVRLDVSAGAKRLDTAKFLKMFTPLDYPQYYKLTPDTKKIKADPTFPIDEYYKSGANVVKVKEVEE